MPLLVNSESFAPFNNTDAERAKALLEKNFQPLRDLTPGGGAYINEARHISPILSFLCPIRVKILTIFHRLFRSNKIINKPFGAATTQDCCKSSVRSTQPMCSGAHHAWATRDGKSVKMDNFVRNDADIRARHSANHLLLRLAGKMDLVITFLVNSHQIGNRVEQCNTGHSRKPIHVQCMYDKPLSIAGNLRQFKQVYEVSLYD